MTDYGFALGVVAGLWLGGAIVWSILGDRIERLEKELAAYQTAISPIDGIAAEFLRDRMA